MDRILEPEVMDDPEQVLAYAQANFEAENQGFVDRFLELYDDVDEAHILDLGCGPGDIPSASFDNVLPVVLPALMPPLP